MRNILLLLVAFLSGAILMGLELVGSRVLAPHFGGSIFVWGSLIGVFLAALSTGYYIGGNLADKYPRSTVLALFLLLAALFVLLLPHFGPIICDAIAVHDFGPRLNPLLACMVLFFIPGLLMGATSPFVIRLTAVTIEQVGRTAGAVYALSTIGSIAGTLITSFFLISWLFTSKTLYLFSVLLFVTSLVAALVSLVRPPQPQKSPSKKSTNKETRKAAKEAAVAVLICAIFLSLWACHPSKAAGTAKTLVECDSPYQRLFVVENDTYRLMQTSSVMHTQMKLSDPFGRGFPYTDYVDIAFLLNPQIKEVLIIGLGGGSIPKRLVRDYKHINVDVVEIDPKVIELAAQYFYLKPGPNLKVYEADGRIFLRRSKKKYDLIMMDAYYEDTVPFFLTTREFFKIASDKLSDNGIFMNNVIGVVSGPKSKFFRSIYRTTKEVYPQVYVFKVPDPGAQFFNIEVFATKNKQPVSIETMRKRLAGEDCKIRDKTLMDGLLGHILSENIRTDDVPTLQDDYAPVDALIHLW